VVFISGLVFSPKGKLFGSSPSGGATYNNKTVILL
jgi:hypothetical protein